MAKLAHMNRFIPLDELDGSNLANCVNLPSDPPSAWVWKT